MADMAGLSRAAVHAGGRVVVIDDDPDILEALGSLIELGGHACERYASARDYLQAMAGAGEREAGPVCLLCDVRMPQMDGLQLQAHLQQRQALPVILMSGAGSAQDAVSGFRAGAVDFLIKPIEADQLFAALDKALASSRRQLQAGVQQAQVRTRVDSLSERELEVARLLARGLTHLGVSLELGISPRTVKFHRQRIFEKLGISGTPELVRLLMAYPD